MLALCIFLYKTDLFLLHRNLIIAPHDLVKYLSIHGNTQFAIILLRNGPLALCAKLDRGEPATASKAL